MAGLSKPDKRQAIAAALYDVVPADPVVRSSALQFGLAYLGFQSDAQSRRRERNNWWLMSLLVAMTIMGAIVEDNLSAKLFCAALGSLMLVALPVGISRTRQIQRNIALLSEFELSEHPGSSTSPATHQSPINEAE